MNRVLLNLQRKELHDVLMSRGVSPALVKWTNDAKGWTNSAVETLEVGLCHFVFSDDRDGGYNIHMKPASNGTGVMGEVGLPWAQVTNLFSNWAIHVKNELAQDDPWRQYSAYLPPEQISKGGNNSPFTHKEAEHVAQSIHILQEHVKKQLPNYAKVADEFDPQFERIASRAKEGAGRIDWSNQFVGMLISLCMTLALAPDAASEIWHFWIQIVNGLLPR